jgi:hypothetical protein
MKAVAAASPLPGLLTQQVHTMTSLQGSEKTAQDRVVAPGTSLDKSLSEKVHTENPNVQLQAKHIDDARHAKGTHAVNQQFGTMQIVDNTAAVRDTAGFTTPPDRPETLDALLKSSKVDNIDHLPEVTQHGIRQGGLSDCHFVSAMEDVRNQSGGDQKLKQMCQPPDGANWVTDKKDGDPTHEDPNGHYDNYLVQFPGYLVPVSVKWSEVHKDDGAFDSTAFGDIKQLDPSKHLPDGEKSRYPAILEVAAGKIFARHKWGVLDPAQNMNVASEGNRHLDGSNDLSDGATHSQELLTGKVSHSQDIVDSSKFDNIQLLQKMLDEGNLVSVRQSGNGDAHQLSVVATGHDQQSGNYVVVKNPQAQYEANKTMFGKDFTGYETDPVTQGVRIPTVDFPKMFTRVDYQYTPSGL